jgi:hypothetical protein
VQAGRRFRGLTVALAATALFALPAGAHATPQFRINGTLAGTAKQNVVQFGTLKLHNALYGEWTCKVLAGVAIWNESEEGFASVQGFQPYLCSASKCPGEAFVTTGGHPELIEEENPETKKIVYKATRGSTSLPWPAETVSEAGTRLVIGKMHIVLECPSEALEVQFSMGPLTPLIVNGAKNGLNASHLLFEGEGGKTGYLEPCPVLGVVETTDCRLYFSGELTTLGTEQELVTAE